MSEEPHNDFRLGPFSVGDLIALGAVLATAGGAYANVSILMKEQDRQAIRLQALEQIVPSEYVRRTEYREDWREIKQTLVRIETKLDTKVDK